MSDLSEAQKLLNRTKRQCDLIEESAKAAGGTSAPWSMNHGHVVRYDRVKVGDTIVDNSYDVCQQPWGKQHTIVGINKRCGERYDMRHIALCNPQFMTRLVADIRVLAEKAAKYDALMEETSCRNA